MYDIDRLRTSKTEQEEEEEEEEDGFAQRIKFGMCVYSFVDMD
jgi:hypothetical protein